MRLSKDAINVMCEGLRRVRRIPEREWLEPIIERLTRLQPGERLVIELLDLNNPEHR